MKNFKKIGCALIGCAMVVSMFTGCSTQKATPVKQDTVKNQETDAVQLVNQEKTSQEIARERIAARSANPDSSAVEKTSQEIAKERMAARKAAESEPSEPAENEAEQTEATDPTGTESEATEPVISMQNNPSAKPTEQKPAESTQTQPKPTEPAPTEPAPTEPAPTEAAPTEPEKEYIDLAALEEYGRQYAASLGFIPNASLTMDNSSYGPCMAETFTSMDDARWDVAGYVQATYNDLMAADGTIEGAGCNVCIIDRGDGTYFIYVLYG